jgi:hypothetical protein
VGQHGRAHEGQHHRGAERQQHAGPRPRLQPRGLRLGVDHTPIVFIQQALEHVFDSIAERAAARFVEASQACRARVLGDDLGAVGVERRHRLGQERALAPRPHEAAQALEVGLHARGAVIPRGRVARVAQHGIARLEPRQ